MMRWWLLLVVGLLAACSNQVFSETPLVAPDERPEDVVRPGRWKVLGEACGEVRPPVAWTECGDSVLFDGEALVFDESGKIPVQVAADEPTILQARGIGDRLVGRSLDDFARRQQGKPPLLKGDPPPFYLYFVIEPVRRDAEGRVIDLRLRSVQCGAPARPLEPTDKPEAGLVMDEEANNCLAADRSALAAAARATLGRLSDRSEERYVWLGDLTEADRTKIAQSTIAE